MTANDLKQMQDYLQKAAAVPWDKILNWGVPGAIGAASGGVGYYLTGDPIMAGASATLGMSARPAVWKQIYHMPDPIAQNKAVLGEVVRKPLIVGGVGVLNYGSQALANTAGITKDFKTHSAETAGNIGAMTGDLAGAARASNTGISDLAKSQDQWRRLAIAATVLMAAGTAGTLYYANRGNKNQAALASAAKVQGQGLKGMAEAMDNSKVYIWQKDKKAVPQPGETNVDTISSIDEKQTLKVAAEASSQPPNVPSAAVSAAKPPTSAAISPAKTMANPFEAQLNKFKGLANRGQLTR